MDERYNWPVNYENPPELMYPQISNPLEDKVQFFI